MIIVDLSFRLLCASPQAEFQRAVALGRYVLAENLSAREMSIIRPMFDEVSFEDKLAGAGVFEIVGDKFYQWVVQIGALSAVACSAGARSQPMVHIVISFHKHEDPTLDQCKEAVSLLLEVCNARNLAVIWAKHKNTLNSHIHVAICRVDPASLRIREIADGWLIDALHQSAAVIEARLGFRREPNALYVADSSGAVWRRSSDELVRSSAGEQLFKAGDRAKYLEERRQSPQWQSIAQVLMSSKTWNDVDVGLEPLGVGYLKLIGGGAKLLMPDYTVIKPSHLGRCFSVSALEKKIGPYTAPEGGSTLLSPAARWQHFIKQKKNLEELVNQVQYVSTKVIDKSSDLHVDQSVRDGFDSYILQKLNLLIFIEAIKRKIKGAVRTASQWWHQRGPVDIEACTLAAIAPRIRGSFPMQLLNDIGARGPIRLLLDDQSSPFAIDFGSIIIAAPNDERDTQEVVKLAASRWAAADLWTAVAFEGEWRVASNSVLKLAFIDRSIQASPPNLGQLEEVSPPKIVDEMLDRHPNKDQLLGDCSVVNVDEANQSEEKIRETRRSFAECPTFRAATQLRKSYLKRDASGIVASQGRRLSELPRLDVVCLNQWSELLLHQDAGSDLQWQDESSGRVRRSGGSPGRVDDEIVEVIASLESAINEGKPDDGQEVRIIEEKSTDLRPQLHEFTDVIKKSQILVGKSAGPENPVSVESSKPAAHQPARKSAAPPPTRKPRLSAGESFKLKQEQALRVRIAEAEKLYPDPSVVKNAKVLEFVIQLRLAKENHELVEIVEDIVRDSSAVKECLKFGSAIWTRLHEVDNLKTQMQEEDYRALTRRYLSRSD